jgi:PleD family two-component response regulator
VLSEIMRDERTKGIPVVVVSGVDDASNASVLVEAGAADYLTKPVNSGLLRARVSRCIEGKRMRERNQRLYSELQANYTKLHELERLRDGLTHMIVHDLRTPLTSMLSA